MYIFNILYIYVYMILYDINKYIVRYNMINV